MKGIIVLILVLHTCLMGLAQETFPTFLAGTWKIENKEEFEHWDLMNDRSLKGISYSVKNNQMLISEYLEITQDKKNITYSATVKGQNQGRSISFKCTKNDSMLVFENSAHDFPKKIVYHRKSETEIDVRVSDGKEKGFGYRLSRYPEKFLSSDSANSNPNFDPALAHKLGGDDYGMKSYVLVMLKTGKRSTDDKKFVQQCFRGHMENIERMVKDGKLTVAGPLGKNDQTYRGIFILQVSTFEEATVLLQNDAAIKEGLLDYELYNWYGSAALPEYLDASDKIWKIKP